MTTYLIGLLIFVAMIAYPFGARWVILKLFKDDIFNNNYGILGGFVLAYLFPFALILIAMVPYVIGKELGF